MKFLLTSAGIRNTSIHDALIDLLGKPIVESSALCIPTAIYPFPSRPSMAYRFISGSIATMCELGSKFCPRGTGSCLRPNGNECCSRTPNKRTHAHSHRTK